MCDMAHAPLFAALAALAIITLVWQPIVALAIIVVALAGRGLCRLIGVGGERFFIGSGTGTARHHHLH